MTKGRLRIARLKIVALLSDSWPFSRKFYNLLIESWLRFFVCFKITKNGISCRHCTEKAPPFH